MVPGLKGQLQSHPLGQGLGKEDCSAGHVLGILGVVLFLAHKEELEEERVAEQELTISRGGTRHQAQDRCPLLRPGCSAPLRLQPHSVTTLELT